MSAIDELNPNDGHLPLDQIDQILGNQEKETPADSSPEKKPVDPTPSSEEPKEDASDAQSSDRLADHPRFREVIQEKNDYRSRLEEAQKKLEELTREDKPQESHSFTQPAQSPSSEQVQIPPEFVQFYGQEDPNAYNALNRLFSQVADQRITQYEKARQAYESKEREKARLQHEIQKANEEKIESELDVISKKNGIDKNEFRAWFAEAPVLNKDGVSFNFERGMELYLAVQKKKPSRRSLGESTGIETTDKQEKVRTLDEIKQMPWSRIGNH